MPASSPLSSMTGFAREAGALPDGAPFAWELRSVNGRGLELRFRLPPGMEALEAAAREATGKTLKRGSVQVALSVQRDQRPVLSPDPAALERALGMALELSARIPGAPAPRAEALLALPGILRAEIPEPAEGEEEARRAALLAAFGRALDALASSRIGEGERLRAVLEGLLDEVAALSAAARQEAETQPGAQRARLEEALDRLLGEEGRRRFPEERLAQEVALLAARSDVREELDRLDSHIAAARALLQEGEAIGRRLDFLGQEFVREANTLCSKSASTELTRLGLELKAAIERLKEQAANVE
ncbi:YicC/YloC family endoribonuclease [Sabulicella rubraurantiaca]|uniref:YicC/YloC family endoribonuclease n=1 Tax=Sabulicella rubraurantiaca TaxID=2811429 RepID=UPI001F1EA555|nr:YicC/YloC family endoribonuclease [Sabulicella rubraurantiaca]